MPQAKGVSEAPAPGVFSRREQEPQFSLCNVQDLVNKMNDGGIMNRHPIPDYSSTSARALKFDMHGFRTLGNVG
jgi:hypothetical protein